MTPLLADALGTLWFVLLPVALVGGMVLEAKFNLVKKVFNW